MISGIVSKRQLVRLGRLFRKQKKRIVFTNGCFDVLHAGHVRYLEQAKLLGDVLVVGINSDNSVKRLKGNNRPVNHFKDRAAVLLALKSVDLVVGFHENTPLVLIRTLKPHVLVKGADWKSNEIVGALEVKSWGGSVKRIRLLKGRSTSKILSKIRQMNEYASE